MSGASYKSKWRNEEKFWSEWKTRLMIVFLLAIIIICLVVELIFGKLASSFSGLFLFVLWFIYGRREEHLELI